MIEITVYIHDNISMKKQCIAIILGLAGLSVFAQATELAPGARANFKGLLNNPAMVQPAVVTPMGKNWFKMETDAHAFTDQVSVKQVADVLLDLENQEKFFNGKRSKLTAALVSRGAQGDTVDFVMTSILGPFKINTPYRTLVKTIENTESKFILDIRQLDSNSNAKIKNMVAIRYAERVTIDGKPYTYIRIYSIDEADASILPGAKGILEKNAAPINVEAIEMIIAAAKTK